MSYDQGVLNHGGMTGTIHRHIYAPISYEPKGKLVYEQAKRAV